MTLNKNIWLAVKLLVVILSIGFIYVKLTKQFHNNDFKQVYKQIEWQNIWLIFSVILMTFFNWFTETLKWRYLVRKLQNISISNSYKAVLSGITVSIVTPNRVGEFGGRILALERRNRIAGVFATLLGGYSQLLITLTCGIIALPLYLSKFPNQIPFKINHSLLFFICFVVISLCLFVYFKIEFFARLIESFIKEEKKKRFVRFLKDYKKIELLNILSFSFVRYLIFSTQFYLVLRFFGIQLPYTDAILGISLIYFLLAIIPVVSLFEFSVRGSIAVLILGVFSPLSIGIMSASILLWAINIALPALIGSITLFKLKV